MARYIDADALIRERTTFMQDEEAFDVSVVLVTDIKLAPTADVAEVKHGHWILHSDGSGTCTRCGFTQKNVWDYDNWQNFCGHCGTKMDEEA